MVSMVDKCNDAVTNFPDLCRLDHFAQIELKEGTGGEHHGGNVLFDSESEDEEDQINEDLEAEPQELSSSKIVVLADDDLWSAFHGYQRVGNKLVVRIEPIVQTLIQNALLSREKET